MQSQRHLTFSFFFPESHSKTYHPALSTQEREEESARLNQETLDLTRLRDTLMRKLRSADQHREEAEMQRENVLMRSKRLERELEAARREIEAEKRLMDGLRHEREVLKKSILKAQGRWILKVRFFRHT